MNTLTINNNITKAFEHGISSFCHFDGVKGDSIDNMIVNTIIKYCPMIMPIDLPTWKHLQRQDFYKPIKNKIQLMARERYGNCLDFVIDSYYPNPLLIRQPNNSQQWPDILIIYKSRGMSIEIKSSKHDQVVWNSGLPRLNCIYIYNGSSNQPSSLSETTYFLGQHIISNMQREILYKAKDENHQISKGYNEQLINSGWSLYARPMFNYSGKFLGSETRNQRETDVLDFIKYFNWE